MASSLQAISEDIAVVCSPAMQASMAELQSLQSLFGTREDALRTGILLDNRRYEVCRLYTACGASLDTTEVK